MFSAFWSLVLFYVNFPLKRQYTHRGLCALDVEVHGTFTWVKKFFPLIK